MHLILPKSDIMQASAPLVRESTKELSPLGITMFSYTRSYSDGSFIDISDRADMVDYYYYQTDIYRHYTPDVQQANIGEGYFMLPTAEIANSPLAPIRDDLNLDNAFSIIKKNDNFYEVWNYATYKNNHSIINFYLNNLHFLESFSLRFKEDMCDLIAEYEKDKIWRSLPETMNDVSLLKVPYKNSKLSLRQLQCANLLIQGKTIKQIANSLQLSPRTIELYLNNMKAKLNCRNKSELVVKLMLRQP